MKIYEVGGAVRDSLLGLPVKDRDYVVVGATPDEMIAAGYRPVGSDFPVFLHPATHAEYALARTERKTAPGYKGFVFHADPSVTLEEDLRRRDLTINAIARDLETGALIDPHDGQVDLAQHVLRHVSEAFIEDPVRILRVARFAARFSDRHFTVAPETMTLMQHMVASGEVDHLVAERVWQEVARGLMESAPAAMLDVLDASGALARIVPEWRNAIAHGSASRRALERAAAAEAPLELRFAALCHDLPVEDIDALCARLRVPTDCRDLAGMSARHHARIDQAQTLPAQALLDVLTACDAIRRPARFTLLLRLCQIIHSQAGLGAPYAPADLFHDLLERLDEIDVRRIAARPDFQPSMIHDARLAKVAETLRKEKS
jgi:tRNA nucleotidyltransferase (CCA-adding enzyme)